MIRSATPGFTSTLTFVFAATAVALVLLRFEPRLAAAQRRLADATQILRSDEVAFANVPELERQRAELSRRFGAVASGNAEAGFLRDLARIAARYRVRVVSTAFAAQDPDGASAASAVHRPSLGERHATVALEGDYRGLLEATAALSRGSELVAVRAPSLGRESGALVARIPVSLYVPAASRP
jgi:hypothetical protein